MRRQTGDLAVSQFKLNENLLFSKFWNAHKGLAVQTSNCCPHLRLKFSFLF